MPDNSQDVFNDPRYEKFFNPLSSRNRRVYFGCISELIEKSGEVPVLYEDDAKDRIALYLKNSGLPLEDNGDLADPYDGISSKRSESDNASAIIRYFRECRWLSEKELDRNAQNLCTVTPQCRKLIKAIDGVFFIQSKGTLTNHIFSIYEILMSAFDETSPRQGRPYTDILVHLVENTDELKNELLTLKDSIRSIMHSVISMTEMNSFGKFLIKDELLKRFFEDYFYIKKGGLIPGYISRIKEMMKELPESPVFERMISEYAKISGDDDRYARDTVIGKVDSIEAFLSDYYEEEMDYIDRRINTYYSLYTMRIYLVLSGGTNIQNTLNSLLKRLSEEDKAKKEDFFAKAAMTGRFSDICYIGRKSIERRKKRRPNVKRVPLVAGSLSNEEKEALSRELFEEDLSRYSIKNTKLYFDVLLGEDRSTEIREEMLRTKDDALMMVSAVIYSGSEGFPYDIEFTEGFLSTEVCDIRNFRIKKREGE